MTKSERREQSEWRRCKLCGKYMGYEEDMKDVSIDSMHSLDPAEPELAHKLCHDQHFLEAILV